MTRYLAIRGAILFCSTFFAAVCLADAPATQPASQPTLKVGSPAPMTPDGKIHVQVFFGDEMEPWFVRSVLLQTQRIQDLYERDGVKVTAFYLPIDNKHPRLMDFFRNENPAFTVAHISVSQANVAAIEDKWDVQGTPLVYFIDKDGIIRQIQDGWKGHNNNEVSTKPWLVQTARKALNTLLKHTGEEGL